MVHEKGSSGNYKKKDYPIICRGVGCKKKKSCYEKTSITLNLIKKAVKRKKRERVKKCTLRKWDSGKAYLKEFTLQIWSGGAP